MNIDRSVLVSRSEVGIISQLSSATSAPTLHTASVEHGTGVPSTSTDSGRSYSSSQVNIRGLRAGFVDACTVPKLTIVVASPAANTSIVE